MKKILLILGVFLIALFFSTGMASSAESWDLTGTYPIVFSCTSGCSGDYPHTMSVNDMDLGDGTFSGTGIYDNNAAYTWDVDGTVSGSEVSFHILYTGSGASYYVDSLTGTIASDGSMSGTAISSSNQKFTWQIPAGAATFVRTAEITSPEENEKVYGLADFEAFLVDDDEDFVDWAVRKGTCAAGTNTVFGNVDGHSDAFDISYNSAEYKYSYSITADVSTWDSGMYCFIFNPREDAGETNIRLTREFYIADGYVSGGGQIREDINNNGTDKNKDDYKISFGGQVWDLGSEGYMGEWQVNFHNVNEEGFDKSKFHTTNITSLNFYTGNDSSCAAAMNFTAIGEWNHISGYKMIFRAGDSCNPKTDDTARVEIFNPDDIKIYDTYWINEFTPESHCVGTARTGLDTGNIKIEF